MVDLKTFLIWLQICLTNTALMSQSKCQVVLGVIFLGKDIPNLIYSIQLYCMIVPY